MSAGSFTSPAEAVGAPPGAPGPTAGAGLWWLCAVVVAVALTASRLGASPAPVALERFVVPGEAPGAEAHGPDISTPPGAPEWIVVPAIGVRARVIPVGLRPDGALETPPAADTGWYELGVRPGERGSAVVVGHVDSRTAPGVFAELPSLPPRSLAGVRDAQGVWTIFRVERLTRHAKDALPRAVWAPGEHRVLRLITCGGEFDRRTGHYRENVVAHAVALGRWRPPAGRADAEPPWDRLQSDA